ncbi:MAG: hypothetical protein ACOCS7_00930 [Halolamina sp.]
MDEILPRLEDVRIGSRLLDELAQDRQREDDPERGRRPRPRGPGNVLREVRCERFHEDRRREIDDA